MSSRLLSELVAVGYEIFLEGENIRLHYRKQEAPPEIAKSLIAELKMHKAEAVNMLKQPNESLSDGVIYWNPYPQGSREARVESLRVINEAAEGSGHPLSVENAMDKILQQTTQDIQAGGNWEAPPQVRE